MCVSLMYVRVFPPDKNGKGKGGGERVEESLTWFCAPEPKESCRDTSLSAEWQKKHILHGKHIFSMWRALAVGGTLAWRHTHQNSLLPRAVTKLHSIVLTHTTHSYKPQHKGEVSHKKYFPRLINTSCPSKPAEHLLPLRFFMFRHVCN